MSRLRRLPVVAAMIITIIALSFGPIQTAIGQVTFELIADYDTVEPDGSSTFTSLGQRPVLDGNTIVFSGNDGIYADFGAGMTTIVDSGTPIPGGGNFVGTSDHSIGVQGTTVAFDGIDTVSRKGIYLNSNGIIQTIADEDTAVPNNTGTFEDFRYPSLDNGNVAFEAWDDSWDGGIYTNLGGTLRAVADESTMIPGTTEPFNVFSSPIVHGQSVTFTGGTTYGENGEKRLGIHRDTGGVLTTLFDTTTTIPDGTGTFTYLPGFDVDGDSIVIQAKGSDNQEGIYLFNGEELITVVDRTTQMLGSSSSGFWGLRAELTLDNGNVAFTAGHGDFHKGIFALYEGELMEVVGVGDELDGKTIFELHMGRDSLSGTNLAFQATMTDGSEAIYMAQIPEPATLSLLAMGGLAMLRRRSTQVLRRRR